jgi:Transglycosylase SLT domain
MAGIADLITAAAQSAGVDPALALAVAQRESGMNPNAPDGTAGEIGIFQLKPSSFPGYSIAQLRDPQTNINVGVGYLASLLAEFGGDPVAAVAAYNWGPTNVAGAIAQHGGDFEISAAPGAPFIPAWLSAAPASVRAYVLSVLPSGVGAGGGAAPAGAPPISYAGVPPPGPPAAGMDLTSVLVLAAVGLLLLWAGSEAVS